MATETKASDRVVWIDRGWQPVVIGFAPSKKAWDTEMERLNSHIPYPMTQNSAGHTHWAENDKTGEAIIMVCVSTKSERDAAEVLSTIVHESVHVWQFLCQHIGEKAPGIEMEAYGIQAIYEGLVDAYTKTQGKGKDWS